MITMIRYIAVRCLLKVHRFLLVIFFGIKSLYHQLDDHVTYIQKQAYHDHPANNQL
jgi:hypothetical protein